MMWDWLAKGAKRVQELGAEYKQHAATVERLLTLDPEEAAQEFARVWPAMDERSRAGLKMTVAGLALAQQGKSKSPEATTRAERLKHLHALIEGALSASAAPFTEAGITSSAARATQKVADLTERAKPRAAEMIESAKRGIEKHGPGIGAAATVVIAGIVKATLDERARQAAASTASSGSGQPTPAPEPDASPRSAGTVPIAGLWEGQLTGSDGTRQVAFRIMPSGRPAFGYQERGQAFCITELTHEGQTLKYVPPGGGVTTVVVQQVTGSSSESGYVIKYSFEGANNGYLTQQYQTLTLTCRLRGSGLEADYVEAGGSYFGDRTGSTGGQSVSGFSGMLRRTGD